MRGLSLYSKFIVAFISVGIAPVLLISFYSGYIFRKQSLSVIEDNYRQAALYGQRNIDGLLEKYNTISKMLYSYSPDNREILRGTGGLGLANLLKKSGGDQDELKRYNDIISFLYLIYSSDSYINNIIFVEPDGRCYAYGRNNRPLTDTEHFLKLASLYKKEEVNKLEIIPTHRDNYFLGSDREVFTLRRNYLDISYPLGVYRILGTLYIEVDTAVFDVVWRPLEVYHNAEILITDEDDNLIYANPVYLDDGAKPEGRSFEIVSPCTLAPWQLVFRLNYNKIMGGIVQTLRLISIIVTLVLTALLILSVFYSRLFVNPVRALLVCMKKVEEGHFNLDVRVKARDEIGQLAAGFYEMTEKLRIYIETSFIAQIRRKEAELSSLKARIKPHFLYNSLEIIRMNAVAHEDTLTADLVLHLAQQMKASMEQPDETVSLSRELDLVRGYFAFIDLRYDHAITLRIQCDPVMEDAEVLSLLIQPVVENAVIHGLKPKGAGQVCIRVHIEQNNLIIIVEDNGIGMDGALVTELTGLLNNEYRSDRKYQKDDSIGLKNVHDRLRYKYGEFYGVSIKSTLGSGSAIQLTLPLKQGKTKDV
jgi:two-component system sensor histidine kinase YesM